MYECTSVYRSAGGGAHPRIRIVTSAPGTLGSAAAIIIDPAASRRARAARDVRPARVA